jgi:hypothetical protein
MRATHVEIGLDKTSLFRIGDFVTTDFYPNDSNLVREIIEIKDYIGASQTGVEITTIDQRGRKLSCDSAWYKLFVGGYGG